MSSPWLPRAPAYQALRPEAPCFTSVDAETAKWLQRKSGLTGQVERLETGAKPPHGHYRLRTAGGDRFLKVLGPGDAAHHRQADELAASARAAGAAVLCCERWVESAEGAHIGIYPYVEGRFAETTSVDGAALGSALAGLHHALGCCPQAAEVKVRSNARLGQLERRRRAVLAGAEALGPDRSVLRSLLEEDATLFDLPTDGQIIHGDVNVGNVLFDAKSGEPLFIDFETALMSWLAPRFDVAMAIERFALTAADPAAAVACARALLEAYTSAAGARPFASGAELARAMRWISLRNLCLLAELQSRGRAVAPSEWRKFLDLARQSQHNAGLFDAIVDGA